MVPWSPLKPLALVPAVTAGNKRARLAQHVLASMDSGVREIFVALVSGESTINDVARRLGIPLGTAKSRLRRARSMLEAGKLRGRSMTKSNSPLPGLDGHGGFTMTEAAQSKPLPIVVRIPDIGLTPHQLKGLERKWEADVNDALQANGAKLKWNIEIKIHIGNE